MITILKEKDLVFRSQSKKIEDVQLEDIAKTSQIYEWSTLVAVVYPKEEKAKILKDTKGRQGEVVTIDELIDVIEFHLY